METKVCTRCKQDLDIKRFPILNKRTGKISSHCEECKREYDREHYAKHKKRRVTIKRETQRQQRRRNMLYMIEHLKAHSCVDCGEDDFIVLEFDHLGNKTGNVGDLARQGCAIERIQKEIDKCEVVCRNCHMRRTVKQFGWYKYIGNGL